jgi:gluconate 2-dehydrogenase gamma chain
MMTRREALQLLATGAALQLAPMKAMAAMREARALVSQQAGAAPRSLNARQEATVKAMAEMILPRTDTPGANDVGTSEFVDLMLTEWCEEAERTFFLKGLADVDAQAQKLFSHDFVSCNPTQQGAVLEVLGDQMTEEIERSPGSNGEGPRNFYSMFRWLTLTAYYTSEQGATQELHFEIIPERHDACVAIASNEVTSNGIKSNHITSNQVTSNEVTSSNGGPQAQ